jgi:Protein of unknown function (DUF1153)
MTSAGIPSRPTNVRGPDGSLINLSNLPLPNVRHWTAARKAIVVAAVKGGLLSLTEACQKYRLSPEEFLTWQELSEQHGEKGLRTTKVKQYRPRTSK